MTEEILRRLIHKGYIAHTGFVRKDGSIDPRAEKFITVPGAVAAVEQELAVEKAEAPEVVEQELAAEKAEAPEVVEQEPAAEKAEAPEVVEQEPETPIIEWQASVENKIYPADGSKCRVGLKLVDCDLTGTDVVLEASADEGVQIGWGSSLEEPLLDLNYKAGTKYLSIAAAAAGTYTITVVLTRDGQALTSTNASVQFGAA